MDKTSMDPLWCKLNVKQELKRRLKPSNLTNKYSKAATGRRS